MIRFIIAIMVTVSPCLAQEQKPEAAPAPAASLSLEAQRAAVKAEFARHHAAEARSQFKKMQPMSPVTPIPGNNK
jgi:hypothetical protein